MRKHLVLVLLVAATVLSGCGSSINGSSSTESISTTKNAITERMTEAETSTNIKSTEQSSETQESSARSLDNIEQYMINAGCLSGDKTEKSAEMVGALKGFGYSNGVEIYEFDTNSDAYKAVSNGEGIPINGMDGYTVHFDAINGEFGLVFSNDNYDQSIVDTFTNY